MKSNLNTCLLILQYLKEIKVEWKTEEFICVDLEKLGLSLMQVEQLPNYTKNISLCWNRNRQDFSQPLGEKKNEF